MLRLMLLRHAKSDWGDPDLRDIDRPLNTRGRSAARTIANYMATEKLLPDLILCSSSQRTRETLAYLLPSLNGEYRVEVRSDLYRQSEGSYIPLLKGVAPDNRTILVVGHNPATEDTAISLAGSGPEDMIRDMQTKFPTGGLAVIDFDFDDWNDLAPGTGRLDRFIKPRELGDEPK